MNRGTSRRGDLACPFRQLAEKNLGGRLPTSAGKLPALPRREGRWLQKCFRHGIRQQFARAGQDKIAVRSSKQTSGDEFAGLVRPIIEQVTGNSIARSKRKRD